jgi:hypothetical protein
MSEARVRCTEIARDRERGIAVVNQELLKARNGRARAADAERAGEGEADAETERCAKRDRSPAHGLPSNHPRRVSTGKLPKLGTSRNSTRASVDGSSAGLRLAQAALGLASPALP